MSLIVLKCYVNEIKYQKYIKLTKDEEIKMSNRFKMWIESHEKHPKVNRLLRFIEENELEEIWNRNSFDSMYDFLDMEGADRRTINNFKYLYENYLAE